METVLTSRSELAEPYVQSEQSEAEGWGQLPAAYHFIRVSGTTFNGWVVEGAYLISSYRFPIVPDDQALHAELEAWQALSDESLTMIDDLIEGG